MTEDLSYYFEKCRCCFAAAEDEVNVQITKTIEKRFYFVANISVRIFFPNHKTFD